MITTAPMNAIRPTTCSISSNASKVPDRFSRLPNSARDHRHPADEDEHDSQRSPARPLVSAQRGAGERERRAVLAPREPADGPEQDRQQQNAERDGSGRQDPARRTMRRDAIEHHEGPEQAEAPADHLAVFDLCGEKVVPALLAPDERRDLFPLTRLVVGAEQLRDQQPPFGPTATLVWLMSCSTLIGLLQDVRLTCQLPAIRAACSAAVFASMGASAGVLAGK